MESTLDAIQVFANSANSVRVFKALSEGATTSKTLAERTGASRSTVARILHKGESRGWVDSKGSQYELTDMGKLMIEEFRAYKQTVDGIQHLGEAISWLPEPVHSLDFRHFRDADIITGIGTNPSKPFDYVAELLRTATEKRSLVETAVPRFVEIIDERAREEQLDAELVIKASWLDTLSGESDQASLWRARADRGNVWAYPGEIPINMHIIDDSVVIWMGERQGDERFIRGLVVTENPAIVSWAESLYKEYQTEAALLDPTKLLET